MVFGGFNNMIDGFVNIYNMYKFKMIVVLIICMVEVIGDDFNVFIKIVKEKGLVFVEYDVFFVYMLVFVGSYVIGYDNVFKGIFEYFWDGKVGIVFKLEWKENGKINFIGGFDGYIVGNFCEIKWIFELMGIEYMILVDNSDVFDMLIDGEFCMYDGGMMFEDVVNVIYVKVMIFM